MTALAQPIQLRAIASGLLLSSRVRLGGWVGSWGDIAAAPTRAALPVAEIVRIDATATTRLVTVLCPFAGKHRSRRRGHEYHVHGWPHDVSDPGIRVPHCDSDPGGFYRLALDPAAAHRAETG